MQPLSVPKSRKEKTPSSLSWKLAFFGVNPGVMLGFVLLVIALWATTPSFRQVSTLQNLLQQVSLNVIISVGMTFVIITAGIDLSVGSVQGLVGTVTALVLMAPPLVARFGSGVMVLAVLAGTGAGILIGLLNGLLVAFLNIQPFIATLATMWILRGLAEVLTNGSPVGTAMPGTPLASLRNNILEHQFTMLGMGYVGPLPLSALVALITVVVGHIILSKTRFGRQVYALGGNLEATRLSGINVKRILLVVYLLSGLLSGIAAILLMSKLVSGQPTAGSGFELYSIAAVVLGGTSLFGGQGSVIGSVIGALIIGIIGMGLDLHGVSSFWQQVVMGVLILLAVLLDQVTRKASYR
ncbi:ribose ABC transporter membrane protein [Chthonomonas calidirosea]|uniref:Ribose ABC transporter membrane protein n=1 Tax=Chthonomonas calidirosea (strain DSM 23976 / ICMP 18418 / T49) TaxID=1303518 RepID=S0EV00_CHTCT|nr:ABC transporter permease [Chthonomonas calidirosea]CCW35558.1 ribose ABC transporter membrane protein [Chthonomonas calidirosea T49]CEK18912.1 ribose ABC transporter membrane protein [Chthonomonas calidirosea]CEK18924.1 ribose ABC transporter membrane protein [Chthonomonas calidirosea]CEK19915.1 ribose ABC transporter membrane protein [Chthonomonas calidirosea]